MIICESVCVSQKIVTPHPHSSVPELEPQYCGEQGVAQEIHLSARMGEPRQPATASRRRIPWEVPGDTKKFSLVLSQPPACP